VRDRRHRHPFINCTACGPRFTIIEDIPYDRPQTTMRDFAMCADCRREYEDPRDRRFHAQPNCCPKCGPRLWLADASGDELPGDGVQLAVAQLLGGGIVAVKGLGGFQLACVAGDVDAVRRLRERKRRPHKPFAVMVRDLDDARALCAVSDAEAAVLCDPARPVVLLRRRADGAAGIAASVAPDLDELGVLLPSTPLHHLLVGAVRVPLVMTSGNVSDEPIARENAEALQRLAGIADAFLLHDRGIYARYDDSVVRVTSGVVRVLRRARGYCPTPVEIEERVEDVLALGAHLKNTFCVLREGHAFVGPHIGDMDNPLTLGHQQEALQTYLRLFRAHPRRVACDLHPDMASTALAERWWDDGAVPVRVQHHHAHIASVMAEHGLRGRLLGVAFDGLGHGPDGTIWGGELLLADEASFTRVGHLAPVRQPGGDLAARQGWRMAVAYLLAAGLRGDALPQWAHEVDGAPDARRLRLVARVAASPTAAPVTTSAGRLFDAVASLLGVAHQSSFEAQAAMRLEALARGFGPAAPVDVATTSGGPLVLDTPGLVRRLYEDRERGRPAAELAAVFHESLAQAVTEACVRLCAEHGVDRVALSGGVFQNALLLERTLELLDQRALRAYANSAVPANDGGISLGQALVAAASAEVRA
jgi:hydrogenase maturation protein HypF